MIPDGKYRCLIPIRSISQGRRAWDPVPNEGQFRQVSIGRIQDICLYEARDTDTGQWPSDLKIRLSAWVLLLGSHTPSHAAHLVQIPPQVVFPFGFG